MRSAQQRVCVTRHQCTNGSSSSSDSKMKKKEKHFPFFKRRVASSSSLLKSREPRSQRGLNVASLPSGNGSLKNKCRRRKKKHVCCLEADGTSPLLFIFFFQKGEGEPQRMGSAPCSCTHAAHNTLHPASSISERGGEPGARLLPPPA